MNRALTCRESTDCEQSSTSIVSPCGSDWRGLLGLGLNVLVTGSQRGLGAFFASAYDSLPSPVCVVTCRNRFAPARAGTLVLCDVDALDRRDQTELSEWLEDPANAATQVISTSSSPLFRAVVANTFDETLYYRLNSIVLDVREA